MCTGKPNRCNVVGARFWAFWHPIGPDRFKLCRDSGRGRSSEVEREPEEAGTRLGAAKRENSNYSITLAAPAGDEADIPDQVLASTRLGPGKKDLKGGPAPQRSKGGAAP